MMRNPSDDNPSGIRPGSPPQERRVPGRGRRRHRGDDDHPPAADAAGRPDRSQSDLLADDPAGQSEHPRAAGVQLVPAAASHRHALPAGPQRLGRKAHPPQRPCRRGHQRLRQGGRRREHRRGDRRIPDPGRDPIRRHHERRGPGERGRGPLHPRRDARQADEHRCRPQRRPHHPGRSPRPPPCHREGIGLLRRDGRRIQVRQGRRRRRPGDHRRQHSRRPDRGRHAEGFRHRPGPDHLHGPDRRRRARQRNQRAARVGCHRRPGHEKRFRGRPRQRPGRSAVEPAKALHGGRRSLDRDWHSAGLPDADLWRRGSGGRRRRLAPLRLADGQSGRGCSCRRCGDSGAPCPRKRSGGPYGRPEGRDDGARSGIRAGGPGRGRRGGRPGRTHRPDPPPDRGRVGLDRAHRPNPR